MAAGLGTRLRPLTDHTPKPLLSVKGRPLITHAFDHLAAAGIERFIVNTHHLAPQFEQAFPDRAWRGPPIVFRHEPVLLETGGGIKNIEDLAEGEPLLVYNSDVLTDLPLGQLLTAREQLGAEVTLGLRTFGGPAHIGFDPGSQRVLDIRGELGVPGLLPCLFTGIYTIEPSFFSRLERGKKESVVPVFVRMIREGLPPAATVIDSGNWDDLGTVEAYEKHR